MFTFVPHAVWGRRLAKRTARLQRCSFWHPDLLLSEIHFSTVKEIACFNQNSSVEVTYSELIRCLGANLAVLFKYPFPNSLCTTESQQRMKNISRVLGLGHCLPFWLLPASISTSRSFSSEIFSTVQYTQDSQWQAVCPGYWWPLETGECQQCFMLFIIIKAVRQLAIFCAWYLFVEDQR